MLFSTSLPASEDGQGVVAPRIPASPGWVCLSAGYGDRVAGQFTGHRSVESSFHEKSDKLIKTPLQIILDLGHRAGLYRLTTVNKNYGCSLVDLSQQHLATSIRDNFKPGSLERLNDNDTLDSRESCHTARGCISSNSSSFRSCSPVDSSHTSIAFCIRSGVADRESRNPPSNRLHLLQWRLCERSCLLAPPPNDLATGVIRNTTLTSTQQSVAYPCTGSHNAHRTDAGLFTEPSFDAGSDPLCARRPIGI